MKIDPNLSLIEISILIPGAFSLFDHFKFDYLNEGSSSFKSACEKAGLPLEKALPLLEELETSRIFDAKGSIKNSSFGELINHILKRYHEPAYTQLIELKTLSTSLKKIPNALSPDIFRLEVRIHELADQLSGHMREEEQFIFPFLIEAEKRAANGESAPPPSCEAPAVKNGPLSVLTWEHEITDNEFHQLRNLTADYTPSAAAGDFLGPLFLRLMELDLETHQHMHLENNILFQKAVEMKILS